MAVPPSSGGGCSALALLFFLLSAPMVTIFHSLSEGDLLFLLSLPVAET